MLLPAWHLRCHRGRISACRCGWGYMCVEVHVCGCTHVYWVHTCVCTCAWLKVWACTHVLLWIHVSVRMCVRALVHRSVHPLHLLLLPPVAPVFSSGLTHSRL